jgi:serine/threonine protein kinase
MSGDIVIVEEDGWPPRAFWLQRKVNQLTHGIVRLGFTLQPNTSPESAGSGETWELTPPETDGHHKKVQIDILDTRILDINLSAEVSPVRNPLYEICALQMVAEHNDTRDAHVVGTKLVATSPQNVFVVMPYHRDGTLFHYCLSKGSLEEPVARFFFRQILKVRAILENKEKLLV